MQDAPRVSCTTRWQYQYGDGEEETGSEWFTGGDTETIAADIDAKLDDRNWHIDSLSETPRTTISEQQTNELKQNHQPEREDADGYCLGLETRGACDTSEYCEYGHAACYSKDDVDTIPTKPGWQLTTHNPDGDPIDEDEAWETLDFERDDYDPSEDSRSVEAILCRMSRWLSIENTGC